MNQPIEVTVMKRILLLSISIAVLFLVTPRMASAQLEIGSNGNVSVGDVSPSNSQRLKVETDASGGSSVWNIAIDGRVLNAGNDNSIAINGVALDNSNTSYGIRGIVNKDGPASSLNYAVFGRADGTGSATAYAGYFQGDVRVTGTFTNPSDASLKESIQLLASAEDVLPRLMRLRPQSFVYTRNPPYAHMSLPEGEHFGLIAQEVEEVFPNLVEDDVHPAEFSDDEDRESRTTGERVNYKSVNYIEMIPLLLQAMQEQQATIEEQQATIEGQQRRIEALEAGRGRR